MNEGRDDYMGAQRTAGEWYVALDARAPHGADDTARMMDACFAEWLTRSSAHEAELERCEAAVTLAQALADDPDLAFAYAEARALASRPRPAALRALHVHSSASAVGASRRLPASRPPRLWSSSRPRQSSTAARAPADARLRWLPRSLRARRP